MLLGGLRTGTGGQFIDPITRSRGTICPRSLDPPVLLAGHGCGFLNFLAGFFLFLMTGLADADDEGALCRFDHVLIDPSPAA